MTESFLWYDLETWGTDPRRTRIAQFGAQRTDTALRALGDPVTVWFRPALDFLPSPGAAQVTGLDPWVLEQRGVCEAEGFRRIQAEMSQGGTCVAGWNSLRFDDEFIRFGLYRNFHDPYAREWAQGNSRWDLLDFARLCHALRPDGIAWPRREDGAPSFRLEHLAAANGIAHHAAHDAMSDVEATLGLARLFRERQPKLWDYHLGFRDKRRAAALLRPGGEPLLHVSQRFPAQRGCAGVVLPLAAHPSAGNQILVAELSQPVEDWRDLDSAAIAARLFVRQDALGEGQTRIPIKAVHLNRCPALVELKHLRNGELERLGLDLPTCLRHAEQLQEGLARVGPRVAEAFVREFESSGDVDGALYDRLPDRADEAVRRRIREAPPADLAGFAGQFADPRGDELLFRYRARNWPETLSADEQQRWSQHLATGLDMAPFDAELALLVEAGQADMAASLRRWSQRVRAAAGLDGQ